MPSLCCFAPAHLHTAGLYNDEHKVVVKVTQFAKTTTAAPTTQVIDVGISNFKALIFLWSGVTAEGFAEGYKAGIGFSDSALRNVSANSTSVDGGASSDTARDSSADKCITMITTPNTVIAEASVSAITNNLVTLSWATNEAVAHLITVIAIGGTDVTDARAEDFVSTTAIGVQSITEPNFRPDVVLFASQKHTTHASQSNANFMLGAGKAVGSEWVTFMYEEDARNPSDGGRMQVKDRCIVQVSPSSGNFESSAKYAGSTTQGFDLDWQEAPTAGTVCIYLAIKGLDVDLGFFNAPTSNQITTQTTTTVPRGILTATAMASTNAGVTAAGRMNIGFGGSDKNQNVMGWGSTDAITPIQAVSSLDSNQVIKTFTEAATASSSTVTSEADIDSYNATDFKLDWFTTDVTAREILWIAFMIKTITVYQVTINEGAVIIDASSITMRARRVITDSAITIAASTILTKVKRPISDSLSIAADTITVRKRFTITESAFLIADAIVLKIKRPITDAAVAIDDTISRIASFFRTINESAVTEDDTITPKAKRPVTESGVSISDSISLRIKRVIADSLSIADSITKRIRLTIAESTVTIADEAFARLVRVRVINEDPVTEDDSISLKIKRLITEPVTSIADNVSRILHARRTMSESGVSVDDTPTARAIRRRTISEAAVDVADSIAIRIKRVISDSLGSIVDTITKRSRLTVNEPAVSQSDSITKRDRRSISETVSIAASTITMRARRIITDAAVVIDDLLTGQLAIERVTIDEPAVPISDTTIRSKVMRVITDTVSIADNVIKSFIFRRTITEPAVVISDAIVRIRIVIQGAGGRIRRRFYGRDYSFR